LLNELDRVVQCQMDTLIASHIRKQRKCHKIWGYPDNRPLSAFRNAHWSALYSVSQGYLGSKLFESSLWKNRRLLRGVQAKLSHKSEVSIKTERPLLDYAVEKLVCEKEWWPATRISELVRFLLGMGADPNETYDGCSPWKRALYHFEWHSLSTSTIERIQLFGEILELMIHFDADPNAICEICDEYFLRPNVKNPYAEGRKEYRYSALRIVGMVCPFTDPNDDVTLRLAVQRLSKRLSELLIANGGQEMEWHDDELVYPRIF
jgi:hypothetical protein